MNVKKRICRLEMLLARNEIVITNLIKRPKLSRLEWLEKIELTMAGMDCIEATRLVLSKRDDGGYSANNPYWDELKKENE
jgi:hypothetical protein